MASIVHKSTEFSSHPSTANVDKVVESVTNATKRLSQISTTTNNSNKKRKTQNRIGPWKLGRTLGRGSTGRVRLAKNVDTGKLAAVKIVPKSNFKKLENPKYKSSDATKLPYGIEREIIIMKLISHPNIMGLHDVWENKNDLYLILEYIEGGELFDYLIKRGRLSEYEAINYFKQIIHGIGYLHQFNICHRDLKPENLLLDFNKNIKIADFGMAALQVNEKLLETSCGSPHYASPEIVAGKNYHGAPSDIWSCGIILFALLTGHLPFDDADIRKLLMKVQNGKFIMPTSLSWEAKDLISRMLHVNPAERIQIRDILKHPLLTKYPDPHSLSSKSANDLILHSNIRPISSKDKIDKEILRNLCILFHNCEEEHIINCLLAPKRSPEKMFYYLLMKYRNEHLSSSPSNYAADDDEEANQGEDIPRSGSVVKITTTDSDGKSQTSVKKVARSTSLASSISTKSRKRPLTNVTNKTFTASNARNKRATSRPASRNASSRSLQSKHRVLSSHNQNISKPLKMEDAKPISRTVTPHANQLKTLAASEDKENMIEHPIQNFKKARKQESVIRDGTILQFQRICQEVFGSDVDHKSVYDMTLTKDKRNLTKDTIHKLEVLNNRMSKASLVLPKLPKTPSATSHLDVVKEPELKNTSNHLSSIERKEKELAASVQKNNDERESMFKKRDLQLEKTNKERMRQSLLLKEKSKEASRIINHNASQRVLSEPNHAFSLDPKSSLLRAKTLASRTPTLLANSRQDKNAIVLQRLGIEVVQPGKLSSSSSSFVKTSTSKDLAAALRSKSPNLGGENAIDLNKTLPEINQERTLSSIRSSASSNTKDNASKHSGPKQGDQLSVKSSSTKNKIKGETITKRSSDTTSADPDLTRMSVRTHHDLIPNPRFSKFSFNEIIKANTDPVENTILEATRSLGTVKRSARQPLNTKQGNGLIRKSPTRDLEGLGIILDANSAEVSKDESRFSGEKNFVSMNVSDDEPTSHCTTLQKDAISVTEASDYSGGEEFDLSDQAVKLGHDTDAQRFSADDSWSHSDESANSEENKSGPASSRKTSRDTLVGDGVERSWSHKSHNTLLPEELSSHGNQSKRHSNSVDDSKKSEFGPQNTRNNVLDTSSLAENTHASLLGREEFMSESNGQDFRTEPFSIENKSQIDQGGSQKSDTHSLADDGIEEIDDKVSLETTSKSLNRQRRDTVGSLRRSAASTQIFSTLHMKEAATQETPPVVEPDHVKHEAPSGSNTPVFGQLPLGVSAKSQEPNPKKWSLMPKRKAPSVPGDDGVKEKSRGHNRFSGISLYSNAKRFVAPKSDDSPKSPSGAGWFKRFFMSLSKGSDKDANEGEVSKANKNMHIIDTSLDSNDLMRVIKNQLKVKEVEGSVINVDVDEEFALISGVVPSRYARGRKLHFKIEVIDLVNSSSLHLQKVKGSKTGFRNLVQVVDFVIKSEEDAVKHGKVKSTH
ncbi:hypothetical protein CJJ07_001593 [Candidozyma auris]|nr:hypothetical protein CJJ07_001593 [[Candida] auris]